MKIKTFEGRMTRFCFETANGKAVALDVFIFMRGKRQPRKFFELTLHLEGVELKVNRYSTYEEGSDGYFSSIVSFHIAPEGGVIYADDVNGKRYAVNIPTEVAQPFCEAIKP